MREKLITIVERISKYFENLVKDIKNIKKSNFLDFIKNRIKLILTFTLIIFLVLGYGIGNVSNSKNILLSKLEKALVEGKEGNLRSVVLVDGKKIERKKLKPIIDYYNQDKNKVYSTINELKSIGESEDFRILEKDGIVGNRYFIEIKEYNLQIDSNFESAKFSIDGGKNYQDIEDSNITLLPGAYNITGILECEYGNIESNKEVLIMGNEVVRLDFDAININVKSEYNDADLCINDDNIGVKVGEIKELGPFPTDGSISLSLEKEFPWGKIKGQEVKVKDIPVINLSIDMKNEVMEQQIFANVEKFYQSVFQALNSEDKSVINKSTEQVKNKIYQILEKKYFFLKNKYEINDIKIVEDKNQYLYLDGEYKATIVVEVKYDVSKNFLGLSKTNNSKDFFTKMIYKDNEWIIDDVENFTL